MPAPAYTAALSLALALATASPARAAPPPPSLVREQAADGLAARLHRAAPELDSAVLDQALRSVRCAQAEGALPEETPPVLAVIDYSRPSTEERLWVLDLDKGELLFREHVAHGQGTGEDLATAFSNRPHSHQSSLGLFRTAETYIGQHGYSLRLDGLEAGVNDRARERAIVVHGAAYATEDFITRNGRLGRSWGCPAVDQAVSAALIDAIKGGAPLFAWYPDDAWQEGSAFLRCEG